MSADNRLEFHMEKNAVFTRISFTVIIIMITNRANSYC